MLLSWEWLKKKSKLHSQDKNMTSCHIQKKIEIKPRTAINMDSRQINILCEILKIYNVVFFLCSLYISFHMLFYWKKTKLLNNHADSFAQPRESPRVRGPPFEKHCITVFRIKQKAMKYQIIMHISKTEIFLTTNFKTNSTLNIQLQRCLNWMQEKMNRPVYSLNASRNCLSYN
jgi:hypothetical protein